jgi:hypothetical protein
VNLVVRCLLDVCFEIGFFLLFLVLSPVVFIYAYGSVRRIFQKFHAPKREAK